MIAVMCNFVHLMESVSRLPYEEVRRYGVHFDKTLKLQSTKHGYGFVLDMRSVGEVVWKCSRSISRSTKEAYKTE